MVFSRPTMTPPPILRAPRSSNTARSNRSDSSSSSGGKHQKVIARSLISDMLETLEVPHESLVPAVSSPDPVITVADPAEKADSSEVSPALGSISCEIVGGIDSSVNNKTEEEEAVIDLMQQALLEIRRSADLSERFKKLLNTLIGLQIVFLIALLVRRILSGDEVSEERSYLCLSPT